jgi:hypothetical protein
MVKSIIHFESMLNSNPNLDQKLKSTPDLDQKKNSFGSTTVLLFCLIDNTKSYVSVSPLYCDVYLENIGFVYPAMSMVVIGPSLLF